MLHTHTLCKMWWGSERDMSTPKRFQSKGGKGGPDCKRDPSASVTADSMKRIFHWTTSIGPTLTKELWGAYRRSGDPTPHPHFNVISSCTLYIHEILIYSTLIGTQQVSLHRFFLPGLDAHLCTFDTSIRGETKQSWWLLSTWIWQSWGGGVIKKGMQL